MAVVYSKTLKFSVSQIIFRDAPVPSPVDDTNHELIKLNASAAARAYDSLYKGSTLPASVLYYSTSDGEASNNNGEVRCTTREVLACEKQHRERREEGNYQRSKLLVLKVGHRQRG
ncbi:jg11002 [Pararge aegeria aegeria]|uniref:Jg11002 protein n=1 Tax=Pararge aegeria aegeria TaxID=348720 RepID=A0A8S4SBD0_9NEOP|nr:jg11002 [Pararge aegeria aegeria]